MEYKIDVLHEIDDSFESEHDKQEPRLLSAIIVGKRTKFSDTRQLEILISLAIISTNIIFSSSLTDSLGANISI